MRKGILWTMVALTAVVLVGCEKKAKQEPAAVEQQMAAGDETAAQQVASGTANVAAAVGQAQVAAGQTAAGIAETAQTVTGAVERVATTASASLEKPTIEKIQQALKNAGLYQGDVDGKLGPRTKKAIEEFQSQNGLTADGKVGPRTWAKLSAHLTNAAPQEASDASAPTAN